MPRYDARRIEARWQAYWDEHETFVTPNEPPTDSQGKLYVLDMFPYPSGDGLHVGHPEGYTATDIVSRYSRMRGKHVLHPMGWDAFGLPAEQHAIKTGTHPRETTQKNIDTFRRQLKMLGFSYDWSREISTTDEDYYRWTQWIFLQLYDTWYDTEHEWTGPDGVTRTGKGRPISELPIPDDVQSAGEEAVRRYQDANRLAYQSDAPVNWCPALGTVLANEEVTADGKSERGNHPVERRKLRQWMLRITAYAERLLTELDDLDWTESIKLLQRNWIGKSTGAEVDFFVQTPESSVQSDNSESLDTGNSKRDFAAWKKQRSESGFPTNPGENVLRVYTTRPDTLFGATYMVVAPEHPIVDRITTDDQRAAVDEYREKAARKSDLDRTDLAKEKTGVFTGAHAINPVNGEPIPIWIADYVLISYGTGAIMAVPAHDQRDLEFQEQFELPIRVVVRPKTGSNQSLYDRYDDEYVDTVCRHIGSRQFNSIVHFHLDGEDSKEDLIARINSEPRQASSIHVVDAKIGVFVFVDKPSIGRLWFTTDGTIHQIPLFEALVEDGVAINSGDYTGLSTPEFKRRIAADLKEGGLGRASVNYRLRDWLFSRQRYWGEPFPIWHELGADGKPTGLTRAVAEDQLPVTLPEMEDFKPKGTPDPPLGAAPDEWLYTTAEDGTRLMRETNSMPQWAGSCWYYLRFADNKNDVAFIDPAVEKYWLPVDLYIGGAEHAVLHLLYSRFWHKVLFDRRHVSTPEPFAKLVNQGMILGEAELTGYRVQSPESSVQSGRSTDPLDTGHSTLDTPWVSARDVKETDNAGETIYKTTDGTIVEPVTVFSEDVVKKGDAFVLQDQPDIVVESRAFKMSKSRGNVINPDDVVSQYGADSLRLYEMFMGPLEQVKPWSMSGVEGVYRFLGRAWRMIVDERADQVTLNAAVQDVPCSDEQERTLHKTIQAVTDDIEKLSFNTAISRLMEFTNEFTKADPRPKTAMEQFTLLLSPFAPHLAEELWHVLGNADSLAYAPWPQFDESKVVDDQIEIPVQINGKVRAKIMIPADAKPPQMQEIAEAAAEVKSHIDCKTVVKVIAVPGRMVNFVVKG